MKIKLQLSKLIMFITVTMFITSMVKDLFLNFCADAEAIAMKIIGLKLN